MKIYAVGFDKNNNIGGGWSFLDYFKRGDWQIVDDPKDCDIYFITSVSMLDKLSQIPINKKVVLRIDNVLKNSCNGRIYGFAEDKITRMEALKEVALRADLIVYQSQWSKNYIKPFLGACKGKQAVIYNGSDDELFNPEGGKLPTDYNPVYLYIRSSNHDNKGWHVAWYEYQKIHRDKSKPKPVLWIVGRFSPENIPNNFDFFNGEEFKYWGFIRDREQMAMMMRTADYLLYPFYNDADSQTLTEAYLSGLSIKWLTGSESGGSPEIRKLINTKGRDALSYKRMNAEYLEVFNGLE